MEKNHGKRGGNHAASGGGDFRKIDPRGEGKTTLRRGEMTLRGGE